MPKRDRSDGDGNGDRAAKRAAPPSVKIPLLSPSAIHEPPVFSPDASDAFLTHYHEHGYAVMTDLLSEDERQRAMGLFWADWTAVSPNAKRDDPTTWTQKNSPVYWSKGMGKSYGLAHGDFMWHMRTQTNLRKPFELLHGTTDLLPSFCAFGVNFGQKCTKRWAHVDQAATNPLHSVQGVYNFLPATAESAGFVVVPKSHAEYVPPASAGRADWCVLENDTERPELVNDIASRAVKLILPAGSFILFNSRCVHENVGVPKPLKTPTMTRLATYVTFGPAAWATPEVRAQRRAAYLAGYATSHWVDKCEAVSSLGMQAIAHRHSGFVALKPRLGPDGGVPVDRAPFV